MAALDTSRWRYGVAVLAGVMCVLSVAVVLELTRTEAKPINVTSVVIVRGEGEYLQEEPTPDSRTVDVYRGYGAWVDVFDFSPPYAGEEPPITADDIADMAADGVSTLYLQAARLDDRSPGGLEDDWLLAEMLMTAHEHDLAVVGWYLPKWELGSADLERMELLDQFEVLGHRFDGVAVDIEWTRDELEPDTRSERLVELSTAVRARSDDPIGAIVLPPVLIEVVNEDFWPGFPWQAIEPLYDVWLPMSYWSFRSDSSGYGDGYTYHEESVRRLRANLGDPDALVHGVGGIGGVDGVDDPDDPEEPLASLDEMQAFLFALRDSDSIGGSIYDWNTLEPAARAVLAEEFSVGEAASLGDG